MYFLQELYNEKETSGEAFPLCAEAAAHLDTGSLRQVEEALEAALENGVDNDSPIDAEESHKSERQEADIVGLPGEAAFLNGEGSEMLQAQRGSDGSTESPDKIKNITVDSSKLPLTNSSEAHGKDVTEHSPVDRQQPVQQASIPTAAGDPALPLPLAVEGGNGEGGTAIPFPCDESQAAGTENKEVRTGMLAGLSADNPASLSVKEIADTGGVEAKASGEPDAEGICSRAFKTCVGDRPDAGESTSSTAKEPDVDRLSHRGELELAASCKDPNLIREPSNSGSIITPEDSLKAEPEATSDGSVPLQVPPSTSDCRSRPGEASDTAAVEGIARTAAIAAATAIALEAESRAQMARNQNLKSKDMPEMASLSSDERDVDSRVNFEAESSKGSFGTQDSMQKQSSGGSHSGQRNRCHFRVSFCDGWLPGEVEDAPPQTSEAFRRASIVSITAISLRSVGVVAHSVLYF